MLSYILITGPPEIRLNDDTINTFSSLPPGINRAEVAVLTQNVVLSTNLVGRWKRPDDSTVLQNSITFRIFHQSDEGLYKFYVNSWNGSQALAIQMNISIIG